MKYTIFILCIILLLSSCIRRKCRIPGGYDFEIPVTLSPAQETYRIGDTISISSVFSDEVYERVTNQFYVLEDIAFSPGIGIAEISGITDTISVHFDVLIAPKFNFLGPVYLEGPLEYSGQYHYENREYSLTYQIIPKQTGLFIFSHSAALGELGSDQDFDGKCRGESIATTRTTLNGGADNNIHLLSESPDPHYNDWILQKPNERFHGSGSFAFRVVE